MNFIDDSTLNELLTFDKLVPALKKAFASDIKAPVRHHHQYKNRKDGSESTLLIMPAWEEGKELGVKVVTVSPENSKYDLPAIHGIYLLFDAHKGQPLAVMDARIITARRTAAASALASQFLSREDASTLLMIGTGVLAPNLIEAHASVRPVEKVIIWGRNLAKAEKLAGEFSDRSFEVLLVDEIGKAIADADIVSCATLSDEPLVQGRYLREGTHVDLLGAFRPDMREADDDVIKRSTLFVDSRESTPEETGDLVIPIKNGILKKEDIRGDLFELCRGEMRGRESEKEITCFKSAGHALEDLVAARLVYDQL